MLLNTEETSENTSKHVTVINVIQTSACLLPSHEFNKKKHIIFKQEPEMHQVFCSVTMSQHKQMLNKHLLTEHFTRLIIKYFFKSFHVECRQCKL